MSQWFEQLRENPVPGTKTRTVAGKVATVRHGKRLGAKEMRSRARKIKPAVYYRKAISQKMPTIKVPVLRSELGLSQAELARVTGYSLRAIAGWESGKPLSASARQKMIEAHRLREALAQIMPLERLGVWMRTPNPAFEGQTPIQVIERGESDRLWRMIVQIDSNVAT
jgi:DNA-binding transcriptional regulator YiaG